MIRHRAVQLLRPFLLAAPPLELTPEKLEAFEGGGPGAFPVHEYLRWLVAERPVLLHGSGDPELEVLRPREQTDFDGRPARAVFASPDGIWPIFFAIVDRANVGSLRNGCIPGRDGSRYWFSVEPTRPGLYPWSAGYVYVVPRKGFTPHPVGSEWTSEEPVRPIARVPVEPSDFPFLGLVGRHSGGEPNALTILRAARA